MPIHLPIYLHRCYTRSPRGARNVRGVFERYAENRSPLAGGERFVMLDGVASDFRFINGSAEFPSDEIAHFRV